ncbi:hypothetical protein ACTXG7_03705 [Mycolicibacterium sp. Dal123E01]|uniref:hypothetical protein n=1 Tax=Mycolicibacterium sp. Dal123E01 TaxID=3457578 RepID=UPI00403E691D
MLERISMREYSVGISSVGENRLDPYRVIDPGWRWRGWASAGIGKPCAHRSHRESVSVQPAMEQRLVAVGACLAPGGKAFRRETVVARLSLARFEFVRQQLVKRGGSTE